MDDSRFYFSLFAAFTIGSGIVVLMVLRLRVMLLLRKDDSLIALIHFGFLPLFMPFRLMDDGIIDQRLLRRAQIHNRFQKALWWYMAIVVMIVIFTEMLQKD